MIGKLSGIIDEFATNFLILDVGGVGYQIYASSRTLGALGQTGDAAKVLIDTHVREDAITLYGFADKVEQSWFRLLLSVQGVGAKAAFAILAVCPPEQLGFIIASGDKASVQRADGVGPKLAARILTELKDKAGQIDLSPVSVGASVDKSVKQGAAIGTASSIDHDAVSALVNLGYTKSDAYSAVLRAKDKANDNLELLIVEALKELSA